MNMTDAMVYIIKNKKMPPKELQHDPTLKDKYNRSMEFYISDYLKQIVPDEWLDPSFDKKFKLDWLKLNGLSDEDIRELIS